MIAWASRPGDWPGTLPKQLLVAKFTSRLVAGQNTRVRLSASANPAGYGFTATPAVVYGPGLDSDGDGDGVPDAQDNCPQAMIITSASGAWSAQRTLRSGRDL